MASCKPGRTPTLLLITGVLLAACQTAPPLEESTAWQVRQADLLALTHWQLQGRVNARYQNESHTPRIRWEQDADHYTIRLWGTLNAGATRIEGRPGLVTLEQGNEVRTASSPEALIFEQLGYELPVSQLEYWIRGLPTPDQQHQLELGEFNELIHLQQSGWTVRYEDYRLFGDYSLPRRIEMSRTENNIRLIFVGLDWTVGNPLN
ncbi:MAG: lipoprotein insertase outer membrane protein LolB [Gammaproteobacteria bacterium]|nr:outer membrane lipoprotein LolB [Pseudomonadales bacterium]MCP5345246.1 outer membrane lipoprotein LolB [Pseudomonadales bacterium]